MASPVARALAALIGIFLAVNLAARLFAPNLDSMEWAFDLRGLKHWAVLAIGGCAAVALLAYSLKPMCAPVRRAVTLTMLGLLGLVAIRDLIRALLLNSEGSIRLGMTMTFSALVLMVIALVAMGVWRPRQVRASQAVVASLGTTAVCLIGFPLMQMACFGLTDYRRHADAILVFGARAYADGGISDALSDRMRTACELYRQGLAPRVIVSGGPGDGAIHETDAMRRVAIAGGVPAEAIIIDRQGLNTRSTLANVAALRAQGIQRILAVSHFFHLPRVKLQAQRAGVDCFTVPSPQGHPLERLPYFMAREVAACWVYYLRP